MVQKQPETPSEIIKAARDKSDLTVEELTDRVGITERYLYRIENEGKIGLGGFPGGRCGKGSHAAAQNGCEADQQGQQPRNAPSIEFFHLFTSLLT